MSICLRSPAREPSSTNACLLRRSCSNTSAVKRFGRTSSNAATRGSIFINLCSSLCILEISAASTTSS
uniref:Uncharacterized protein n=1 Tax=Arundo donax TaxID=35708 RepID=A0A0A9F8S2_ARUDO